MQISPRKEPGKGGGGNSSHSNETACPGTPLHTSHADPCITRKASRTGIRQNPEPSSQSRVACDTPEHCCLHKMARRETSARQGTAPPRPAGTPPGARPLSPPSQVFPSHKNEAPPTASGQPLHLPSLDPNPARTYLLLRDPGEAVRGCAGPRAATSCGGAGSRGGPARIPPRAASRRRDGGDAPGCPRSSGGGEGKRGKSDLSAGSFSRPSLSCSSLILPTISPKPQLPPPPQPSLRADTKESSGTSFCCLGTEINKSSLSLQLFPAILSRSCLE